MQNSKLDNAFDMAFEVIEEDLNTAELMQDFSFYQTSSRPRSGSRASSCSTEFEPAGQQIHRSTMEAENPAAVLIDEQETSDPCRRVPNLNYNVWEDNSDDTYLFWDDNESTGMTRVQSIEHYPTIKTQLKCEVPDITEQMNTVQLADSTCDLSSQSKQDTDQDLYLNFLNLKRFYFKKDSKTEYIEDSEVYIFLKASLKINQVKVYLKELENAVTTIKDALELQASFNEHKGLLIADLNLLSPCAQQTEWQLCVVTQFEDGNSQCCYSSPFQIQTTSSRKGSNERSSCYQHDGIQMNTNDDTADQTLTLPQHCDYDSSESCDQKPAAYKPIIQLLPGSKVTMNHVHVELCNEDDVVLIQEQPEFAGLLKLVKRKTKRDPMGRRRANGFRSAEETFLWVCGHCFFKRLKKSTVKSHVHRKVCLRNRRIFAESQLKGQKKHVFRRSNTFPFVNERCSPSPYDDETFLSKTP